MGNGPSIDGLPIKNGGSFHGYVSHNQIVYIPPISGFTKIRHRSLPCLLPMVGIASAGGRCRSLGPGAWNEATPRFRSKWRWPFLMSSARTSTSWHVNGRKSGFKSSKVAWQIWATIAQGELLSKPWSQVHLPRLGKKEALNLQNFTAPHDGWKNQLQWNSFNENKWLSLHFYVAVLLILKHASVTRENQGHGSQATCWPPNGLVLMCWCERRGEVKRPMGTENVGRNDGYPLVN